MLPQTTTTFVKHHTNHHHHRRMNSPKVIEEVIEYSLAQYVVLDLRQFHLLTVEDCETEGGQLKTRSDRFYVPAKQRGRW